MQDEREPRRVSVGDCASGSANATATTASTSEGFEQPAVDAQTRLAQETATGQRDLGRRVSRRAGRPEDLGRRVPGQHPSRPRDQQVRPP